jgi:hypothetical protein
VLNQSGLETPRLHLPRLAAWSLAASLAVGPASFAQPGLALWLAEGDAVLKARTADGDLQVAFAAEAPVRALAVDDAAGRVWFYAGGSLHAVATDGSPRITITVPTADDPRVALDLNDADGTVWLGVGSQLWRYSSSGTELATVALPSSVRALEVDPGRQAVWAATETGLRAFDLVSGSPVDWWFPLPGGGTPAMDVSLSAETGWIYEISGGNIRRLLPDPDFGWTAVWFQVPAPDAHVVAARADGAYFATPDTLHRISEDGVIVWSVTPFPHEGAIVDLEVDPSDGSVWVAGSRRITQVSDAGNVLRLFDFPSLIQIRDLDLSIDLVFDVTPPQVTPVSPPPGSAVATASPIIQATFSDDSSGIDISTVRLVLDGVDHTSDLIVGEALASLIPSTPLPDGTIAVSFSVSDKAQNVGTVNWSFVVDTLAPEVEIVAPGDELVIASEAPDTIVDFSDSGSGVDPGSLRLHAGELLVPCVPAAASANCSMSGLRNGTHQLRAEIADRAGNIATAERQFELRLDFLPPVLTLESPAVDALVGSPEVEVRGMVTDDGEVAEVTLNEDVIFLTNSSFSSLRTLNEGENTVRLTAADTTGKTSSVTRTIVLDTFPPQLILDVPSPGAVTNNPEIQVAGRAIDDHLVEIRVAGVAVPVTDGSFDRRVPVEIGENLLIVEAVDGAGNRAIEQRALRRIDLPGIEIASPADLAYLAASTVDVTGNVVASVETVEVNGISAHLSGGTFVAHDVPLIEGGNILTATVREVSGLTSTDSIFVVRDLSPPRLHIDNPRDRATVETATVAVFGMVNDIVAGTVNATEVEVSVNGIAAEVANRSFLARSVPLALGENAIVVIARDRGGNETMEEIAIRRIEPASRRLTIAGGDLQSGAIGTTLPQPLEVRALDSADAPVAGVPVLFSVRGGDGVLDGDSRQVRVVTGADGRAAVNFRLGHRAGISSQRVEAFASGFGYALSFVASAQPAVPSRIFLDAGNLQTGVTGRHLPRPLTAVVTDNGFNRLAGVAVRFRVVKGGGGFDDGVSQIDVVTDSDGRAIAPFVLGDEEGVSNNVVEASLPPSGGPFVTFVASALAAGMPADTSISGVVLDNSNDPVAGVTLRLLGTTIQAQSDARGYFRIPDAPVGTVKLVVDGSTATRPGAWPDLEFVLTTVSGRNNTLGMPIFLLPLDLGQGIHVSETNGGTLKLAELPGFALEIAPGSVTFPGGSRSGLVSATLVHGDKVPMVPNFGQQPRLIVTIQPAGARFDPPARLTLPNTEGLSPGG